MPWEALAQVAMSPSPQARSRFLATLAAGLLVASGVATASDDRPGSGAGPAPLDVLEEGDPGEDNGESASASLQASDPDAAELNASVRAIGGEGDLGRGGFATVEFVEILGSQAIDVDVEARGGQGVFGSTGHVVSVYGGSTGGPVSVRATAIGGDADGEGGHAGNTSLVNAVDGDAVGSLTLQQLAIGGGALGDALGGGRASSSLVSEKSVDALRIHSEAIGGTGRAVEGSPWATGTAVARAAGTNHAGDVEVNAVATGGRRAPGDGTLDVEGGSATAASEGTTFGDGHSVTVGSEDTTNAQGGEGIGPGARGGDANSSSIGTAHGDAQVTVHDQAIGGHGGDGGRGGDASASARGENTGASQVVTGAVAVAGSAGTTSSAEPSGGTGGDASAESWGIGGGIVSVYATAEGGGGGRGTAQGGHGGAAILRSVWGESTGGSAVSVFAGAAGGSGGDGTAEDATGGDGGSVVLIQAVDGETTGSLGLTQVAVGGNAGSGSGSSGVSGSARSELTKSTTSDSLEVVTEAYAGRSEGAHGDATSVSEAHNGGGAAHASASSLVAPPPPSPFPPPNPGTVSNLDATATAIASGALTGDTTSVATAVGGANAQSVATAHATTTGTGAVVAFAEAGGRSDLTPTGEGGDAVAEAYGSNAGPAPVVVTATAIAGAGHERDGTATASAEGISSAGGDVTVEAEAVATSVDGGEVSLHDAVRGGTSGRLELRQRVAHGVHGVLGPGGDSITSLVAANRGGGDLVLGVEVSGGNGVGDGGDAVVGDVIGTSTTGHDVEIDVFALGGFGERETGFGPVGGAGAAGSIVQENRRLGEDPSPSRIHGESNGGAVTVAARFQVQGAGSSLALGEGGDGASIDLENVISGSTTGDLVLSQSAQAGHGNNDFLGDVPGEGGSARSALTKATHSDSLLLHASAEGGSTGSDLAFRGDEILPGDAEAIVDAFNSGGSVQAYGTAHGGSSAARVADGGAAVVEVHGRTVGDGHDVAIGKPQPRPPVPPDPTVRRFTHGASGGTIPSSGPPPVDFVFGNGGAASSRSVGIAEGDSAVEVYDTANGGSVFTTGGSGGNGGDATSLASATGGGESPVIARSRAGGGSPGRGAARRGGHGSALAEAAGLGYVESRAVASGGRSFEPYPTSPGSARSRAVAAGATGLALADASTGIAPIHQLRVASEAALGARREVVAEAQVGAVLPEASFEPAAHGMGFGTIDPLPEDVEAALAASDAFADRLALDSAPEVVALARWDGRSQEGETLALSTDVDLVLGVDAGSARVILGIFEISILGDPTFELEFSLSKEDSPLGSPVTLTSEAEVLEFFGDRFFSLGAVSARDVVRASFDLVLTGEGSVGMGLELATLVPEPGTGLAMAVGLAIWLAMTRRVGPYT